MNIIILCQFVFCVTIVHSGAPGTDEPFVNHVRRHPAHGQRLDPEVYMNVTELLTSKGYPCEEYTVKTADGYLLGVQRVPHGKNHKFLGGNRPVVFLQHGLLSSADDWADNLVNQSFAFLLADAGFDVWLGNSRGNTYSLRHEKYKPSQREFWDFSCDEMAKYDFPASINFALRVSGARDLVYVGFSQGTEIAFAQLSTDKVLAKKIRLFVALAPVAYLSKVKSPIRLLAPYAFELEILFDLLGVKDFMASSPIFRWLARHFCDKEIPDILCENIMFLFGGFDAQQMNTSRIPVYVAHLPAGTSVKNIVHYCQSRIPVYTSHTPAGTSTRNIIHVTQGIMSGKFQMFDYGPYVNKQRYNQSTPPQYDLSRIDVPMALYSGSADWLADPDDVSRLAAELKTVIKHKVIPGWEHLDFMWAMDSPTDCYNDVIDLIKTVNNIA